MGEDRVPVYIKRSLYEKARRFIEEEGGFESVEELVEFLIQEAVETGEIEGLSPEEEEQVKERLKKLGYL
ncbi:MAG: CopG family transcriptional regulator [Desulfurococcales archaeon]|nr:CopG family transcriptional regulator [Desulfurococcales archaeon]